MPCIFDFCNYQGIKCCDRRSGKGSSQTGTDSEILSEDDCCFPGYVIIAGNIGQGSGVTGGEL